MTTFRDTFCGPLNRHGHMNHDMQVNDVGNTVCTRAGCGHTIDPVVCTCDDTTWTENIGCPSHSPSVKCAHPPMSLGFPGMMREYDRLLDTHAPGWYERYAAKETP